MNNPYAIFLHDTPAVGLFEKPIRAFSSGCVRVQQADQLARRLLDNGDQPIEKSVDLPLLSGDTVITKLATPIEVYLTYFTSWVDDEGEVQFRPDVQQRNTRLFTTLQHDEKELTALRGEPAAESL
jgi:murein L,D-transpeptidase YcbB/YkuD